MKAARKKVLVADCHEEVLIMLEKILEDAGFDTTTVRTAEEVLNQAESRGFDIMVVNEYLPDAECEELLRKLQSKGTRVPCVVMQPSAPDITDVGVLRKLGAREVVCKRSYQQIVEAVSKCLSRRPARLVA